MNFIDEMMEWTSGRVVADWEKTRVGFELCPDPWVAMVACADDIGALGQELQTCLEERKSVDCS